MEDTKNKDDKKEKESPELKEELSEEELKGVTGGLRWCPPVAVGSIPPLSGITVHEGNAQDADHDSARLID